MEVVFELLERSKITVKQECCAKVVMSKVSEEVGLKKEQKNNKLLGYILTALFYVMVVNFVLM